MNWRAQLKAKSAGIVTIPLGDSPPTCGAVTLWSGFELSRTHGLALHAVLCEALTNTQALLARLEAGVHVPRSEQREVVRLLYVATRHQVKALADCYSGRIGLQCKSHSVVCTLPLG